MASMASTDRFSQEFGRLLCDRVGLDPNRVRQDFQVEDVTSKQVMVTLQVATFLPKEELAMLRQIASERATE